MFENKQATFAPPNNSLKGWNVANNFVGEKANRKQLFDKFSTNNVPIKLSFLTTPTTN